ncbi:hypothetical protein [Comamonas guangdongensis]|uniref:Uncharacterized protein n=1 Tax=Comamonas guangdongensis TaxID=510515 RepID=A0ABV4A2Q7_9BURK
MKATKRTAAVIGISVVNDANQPGAGLPQVGFEAIVVIDTAKSTNHLMTLLGRSSLRA